MELPQENLNRINPKAVEPQDISDYLLQRWPMLLIDSIIDHEPGKWAIGIHAASRNESFFTGHYPDNPIMPGTMMLEAMSQVATFILTSGGLVGIKHGAGLLFAGVDKLRFFRVVRPGETILFHCALMDDRMGIYKITGNGRVNGEMCISATMSFALMSKTESQSETEVK